jgi:hypothetical protein
MLFTMLQEQHNKQIKAMAATNKANMDAMMERINAIMAGGGEKRTTQQDKENTPPRGNRRQPAGTGTGSSSGNTRWIMKPWMHSNNTFNSNKYSLSRSHWKTTDATRLSVPSKPSEHTSSQYWQALMTNFPSPYSATSWNQQNSP